MNGYIFFIDTLMQMVALHMGILFTIHTGTDCLPVAWVFTTVQSD